jgi:putative phage-type endonuclease
MNIHNEFRIIPEPFQGSEEWLALRRTKITATDARVLMNVDPWKTKKQLYDEKIGVGTPRKQHAYMKRGLDLEDGIRDQLEHKYGVALQKATVVRGWCLASLDAMSSDGNIIAEIKCPGKKDHGLAMMGQVPDKYYPQLQFSIHVTGLDFIYYESSEDGETTESIIVERNQDYIDDMLEKCYEFYQSVLDGKPPELEEDDFIDRNDPMWFNASEEYKKVRKEIVSLQEREKSLKNQLIYYSMSKNSRGNGLTLQQVERKGVLEYGKLLKILQERVGVDIEKHRKPSSSEWRITIQ